MDDYRSDRVVCHLLAAVEHLFRVHGTGVQTARRTAQYESVRRDNDVLASVGLHELMPQPHSLRFLVG